MAMGSKRFACWITAISLSVVCLATVIEAGGLLGQRNAVGGVSIDATGFVRTATVDETNELVNLTRVALEAPRGDLAAAAELRMVSLKGLQEAIVASRENGGPLPEPISLLAGLQRIEYVFVDQDRQDIVLAGPAEPWKLNPIGAVVGEQSGRSALMLDDLVVAIRSVDAARREGISCSIEPTAEGRRKLKQLLSRVRLLPGQNPASLEPAMREAFGPQQILLTGIPESSRYAMTMVAADYQMKRVAMALTASPVAGLPSYLEMVRNVRQSSQENPRWWMACDYDALTRSPDGMAWKISGQGVKTLTEQDVVAADGTVTESGRTNSAAARWAALMTENYDELARDMPVFSDLRNLMDLTVVATLISEARLAEKAGLDLSVLLGETDAIELASYRAPKAVAPECSFIRGAAGVIVSASGGVSINGFEVVSRQQTDESMTDQRSQALAGKSTSAWWWNF